MVSVTVRWEIGAQSILNRKLLHLHNQAFKSALLNPGQTSLASYIDYCSDGRAFLGPNNTMVVTVSSKAERLSEKGIRGEWMSKSEAPGGGFSDKYFISVT